MQGQVFKLKKYFSIYKEYFKTSLSQVISFRFNFSLQVFMNLCFMGTFFFTASFVFDHIEYIGFWNRTEFFFFLSFVFTLDQIHYVSFSHNFWQFSEDVLLGLFDFHLLKPVSSLFIVFTRYLAISGLMTVIFSLILTIYFGLKLDLSIISWLSIPLCLLVSLALLVGIEILLSLFNFITIEGAGINQTRIQLQHFCRWPDFIYKNPLRLFMIPVLAITSFPVRFLLNNSYWSWFLLMILGTLLLWVCISFFWLKSINLYESPSS